MSQLLLEDFVKLFQPLDTQAQGMTHLFYVQNTPKTDSKPSEEHPSNYTPKPTQL